MWKTKFVTYFVSSILVFAGLFYALIVFYPVGVDWQYTFGQLWQHWDNPYAVRGLANPAWIMLYLPHTALPLKASNAVNLILNITLPALVLYKYHGKAMLPLLAMLYTSPPFLDLIRTNNIEWIPLLGLLLPPQWLIVTMAVKPQSIGGVALIAWKRADHRIKVLIPLVICILASILLYGLWFLHLDWQTIQKPHAAANFAPFPYFVPFGLYLLYRAYKQEDEILAGCATPLLVPYFAVYSLFPLLTLIATKRRLESFYLYIGLWLYVLVMAKRLGAL